jgi:hypothetical protein
MDSLALLLFKPGFTIQALPQDKPPQHFCKQFLTHLDAVIDENLVWKSGISVSEAPNHYNTSFD